MSSNGWGDHRTTRTQLMAEHDALPPHLRRLSCYTVCKWTADSFTHGERDLGLRGIAAYIRRHEQQDTYRTYGPTHPEANAHGARLRPDKHGLWTPTKKDRQTGRQA